MSCVADSTYKFRNLRYKKGFNQHVTLRIKPATNKCVTPVRTGAARGMRAQGPTEACQCHTEARSCRHPSRHSRKGREGRGKQARRRKLLERGHERGVAAERACIFVFGGKFSFILNK